MTTSGGIAGMTGYDVQSTVILELILEAFEQLPPSAQLRPEGRDDLEITWRDPSTSVEHRRFCQIKKASDGTPDIEWSLADVSRVLLSDAVAKLSGNTDEQYWVLGDRLADEVHRLLKAGLNAPQLERTSYLTALHRLAKAETGVTSEITNTAQKHRLDHWNPTSAADVDETVKNFAALAIDVRPARIDAYRQRMVALHAVLPSVLARIQVRAYFGKEHEIADRVRKRLINQYSLDYESVRSVIFRNLRGFINDVSKEPGRTISQEEFERELVEVWPRLITTAEPQPLSADHVRRPALVDALLSPALGREAVGPSGSGKSMLASETYSELRARAPTTVVVFAEVRSTNSLRDLLVGVAYSLHRRGVAEMIGPVLNLRTTDTAAIERVAAAFIPLSRDVVLLIDVADRETNLEFQRDFAVFARALRGTKVRLIAFSQTSVFRELTEIERGSLQIHREAMPGLHFGEFWTMIERQHPGIDRHAVHNIFETLTAGLPTGLLPNLAGELARTKSLAEMQAIAAKPPEQRLNAAHQVRFYSLPPALQAAAFRVVCLSLPLGAGELIDLFPHDSIKAALASLVQEGLIGPYEDRVEMHESVRSGLESLVPSALAKNTHETLAKYFERREMLSARIHHLERAGHTEEARRLARERFLAGGDWVELGEYVGARKCVTAEEVVTLLLDGRHEHAYMLGGVLSQVQTPETATKLLDALRSDPERYARDYRRTWRLQEALLKCDPSSLIPLVVFVLGLPKKKGLSLMDSVLTCAWRAGVAADESFIAWFRALPAEQQTEVVGFLLVKPDFLRLQEAFSILQRNQIPIHARRSHFPGGLILDLTTKEDIDIFLAALPHVEASQMLVARSALLDPFGAFVWEERNLLLHHCRELLARATASEPVLINAIRVLIYLTDHEVIPMTRSFRDGKSNLASVAWMAPVILDAREELPTLESVAVSPETTTESRVMAIVIASHLGADEGMLLERTAAIKPNEKRGLEFILLLQASLTPFPAAVRLLSAALDEQDPKYHSLLGSALMRTAEASFPGTEELLVKSLHSPSPELARAALFVLQRQRLSAALQPILELGYGSNVSTIRSLAILAAIASGPPSVEPFRRLWQAEPGSAHWRWVLAGRLRDASEASGLVAAATDRSLNWKERRVAIAAAGRLPFAAALEPIASAVLIESPLLNDPSIRFQNHAILSGLIESVGIRDLLQRFLRGRTAFIEALGPVFDASSADLIDNTGILPAEAAIGWLWDRLNAHGCGSDERALQAADNELHAPLVQAAALRGLRLQGRRNELFAAFESTANNWLRIRAFAEVCRGEPLSVEEERRAEALMQNTANSLQHVLGAYYSGRPRRERPAPAPRPEATAAPPPAIRMTAEQARAFLRSSDRFDPKAIVLEVNNTDLLGLAVELDPTRDIQWVPSSNASHARVSLSGGGWRLRGGFALNPVSLHFDQRCALRPALAAANHFGVEIPWHRAQLTGDLRDNYADRFFASLEAQNDRDRFVAELNLNADLLLPLLDRPNRVSRVCALIDERALPVLGRFIQAGHVVFFQGLCTLICQVEGVTVRPLLVAAFRRWLVLLEQLQSTPARANPDAPEWRAVWQTLSLMGRHPQFEAIPQLAERLLEVLARYDLWYGHRKDILNILKDKPAAYTQFEIEAIRSVVFDHFLVDEFDTYDETADALFRRVR